MCKNAQECSGGIKGPEWFQLTHFFDLSGGKFEAPAAAVLCTPKNNKLIARTEN